MSQEQNVEPNQRLDKNEHRKAKEKLEASEHNHSSGCGCGT
jgi:hypothetical protein